MRWIVGIVAAVVSASALARAQSPQTRDIDAAIERGVGFLAKDALAWRKEHQCASCHHAALVIWSMHEARQRGHAVDEPVLKELTTWVAGSGDGRTGVPRPASIPNALNAKAVWFALALGSVPQPDEEVQQGQKRLLKTVAGDQDENGVWRSWPETRPPIFGNSDESMTALATLALHTAAATGDAEAAATRDKGIHWLAAARTDDDPQSIAMRLVLWSRLGRPADERQPLVRRIRERQNADGGWSQAGDMASDAWATGQALYALAHAGVSADEPMVGRGQSFLIQVQRPDGSWPMTSRPAKPGDGGAASLIPITGAGSAWAILGLVRTRGPKADR